MTSLTTALSIRAVERLDFALDQWPWPFAAARAADVASHFQVLQRRMPKVWNGRILLMRSHAFTGAALRGRWFETGYADFLAWRDWGFPDASVTNCFAMGALRGADGGFLMGVMGAHTVNAGRIFFVAGTPDPSDVVDGRVDLDASVRREVTEETGLTERDYAAESGWHAVITDHSIALIKLLAAPVTAEALRARIHAHIANEDEPELADVRIVRGPADIDPMMPDFVTAFLAHAWRAAR